jgi:hypothetical protein
LWYRFVHQYRMIRSLLESISHPVQLSSGALHA